MKKILLVTHNYSYTGAPLVLYQLAKTLLQEGDCWGFKREYEIASSGYGIGPLIQDYKDLGITCMYDVTLSHREVLEGFKPDLVICNTLLTHHAVRAAREMGIPVLWWLHEGAWAKTVLWKQDIGVAAIGATKIVVSSTYLKDEVYPYSTLIKYGVPDTGPIPNRVEGPVRFLVAGTVEWRKGQDIVLEAFRGVKGATLTFMGDGWNSPYGQDIAHRTLGTEAGIYCRGPITPEKFQEALDYYDVLLCPSRDEGGYPQVLLQAQERGKLVVAPDICGFKEQVPPGTGILLASNSLTSWRLVIQGIIDKTSRGAALTSPYIRDWVHENNSLQTHVASWVKLVEENL